MADKKDDNGSPSLWPIIIGVIFLFIFVYFVTDNFIMSSFVNIQTVFSKTISFILSIFYFIVNPRLWDILGVISSVLSLIFITIIVFSIIRLREMQINDKIAVEYLTQQAEKRKRERESKMNPRWDHILSLTSSENESDWRLAIIEADSMLDDFLKEKGYFGATMSDRLKSAREGNAFQTSKNAFEAHDIRNKIAHEGVNFALSQMETRRVIRLYESVFEEFNLI